MNEEILRLTEVRVEFAARVIRDSAVLLKHLQQEPAEETAQRVAEAEFRRRLGRMLLEAVQVPPDLQLHPLGPIVERLQDAGYITVADPRQILRGSQIEQSNVNLPQVA
ncbi:MAG: hypothetical protein DWQ34_04585 [Planctomycetota bacterium]|nr:MAG: hypothetical protein DWQ34_04585 [Planctomycetota bacterium]REK21086.1 MAG: hypothetical protein DWQ41_22730 [Planctomycetota bacterium]